MHSYMQLGTKCRKGWLLDPLSNHAPPVRSTSDEGKAVLVISRSPLAKKGGYAVLLTKLPIREHRMPLHEVRYATKELGLVRLVLHAMRISNPKNRRNREGA